LLRSDGNILKGMIKNARLVFKYNDMFKNNVKREEGIIKLRLDDPYGTEKISEI
jgi:hypothetical protein